jgi:hypothetical protein
MSRTRNTTLVAAGLLTAATLLAGPAAPSADAAAACGDAAWVNRFDGYFTVASQYGAKGTLRDRTIFLCSNVNGATSAASAWVMLAGGGANEYAQVGYAKIAGMAGTTRFHEYNDGESNPPNWNRTWWNGFAAGTNHDYRVEYNFSTGKISGSVDGQTFFTTPWSPDAGEWHAGWNGQFAGETLDRGDDVPGTAASKAQFRDAMAKSCRGCAYAPVDGFLISDLGVYKKELVNNDLDFNIWTQR